MFKSISTVSVLAAVLAIACGRTTHDAGDGSLEFATIRTGADADTVSDRLTLTGLDHAYSAHLELSRDAANRRLSLPAGLYAVDVQSTWASDSGDVAVPVRSAPVLVVVAPGCVSTVNLRQVDDSAANTAQTRLDSALR